MKSRLELAQPFRNVFENVAKSMFPWRGSCWRHENAQGQPRHGKWKHNKFCFIFRDMPQTHIVKTWSVMFLCLLSETFKDNHIVESGNIINFVSFFATCHRHTSWKLETLCSFIYFSRCSRTTTSWKVET